MKGPFVFVFVAAIVAIHFGSSFLYKLLRFTHFSSKYSPRFFYIIFAFLEYLVIYVQWNQLHTHTHKTWSVQNCAVPLFTLQAVETWRSRPGSTTISKWPWFDKFYLNYRHVCQVYPSMLCAGRITRVFAESLRRTGRSVVLFTFRFSPK